MPQAFGRRHAIRAARPRSRRFRSSPFTSRAPRRLLRRLQVGGIRVVAIGSLLRAHVRHHRRLPPLLLAPLATRPSRAFQFVLAFLAQHVARRRACSGGRRTTAITTSTPTNREDIHSPLQRGFWWATSAGSSRRRYDETKLRSHPGLRASTPSCAGSTSTTWCRRSRSAVALFLIGGCAAARCGASSCRPCCCGTAPSPSTRCRTCSAAPLHDDRRQPEQLAARAHHLRRGLAQQPPLLPVDREPGLLLVGRST